MTEATGHFRQLLRRIRVVELVRSAMREAGVHSEGRRPDGWDGRQLRHIDLDAA